MVNIASFMAAAMARSMLLAAITVLLAIALIALVAPFVMQGLGRFKANED